MDKGSVPPLSSGENGMTVLEDTIAPSIHIPTFSPFVKCKSEKKMMIYMIFLKIVYLHKKSGFFLLIITIAVDAFGYCIIEKL